MSEVINNWGVVIGFVGATAGLAFSIWRVGSGVSKDTDAKVQRAYKRIDEVKAAVKDEHVSKHVCKVLHEHLQKDVQEIKGDVKKLLSKNGIS